MIRDVLPFLCVRLFARCLINLFGRQQSGKEKREVKVSHLPKMVISLVGGLIVGLGFYF